MPENTDILNPSGDLHFVYPPLTTRLSPNGDPPDDVAQVATQQLFCTRVVQSAGGQSLDYASYNWRVLSPLVNRSQPVDFARMMDVLVPNAELTRVHLGDYVTESEKVDDSESLFAESHLRSYHFGHVFRGQRWWNAKTSEDIISGHAPTFNPMVDGRIEPNQSANKKRDDSNDAYLWVTPGATRTAPAITKSGHSGAVLWTLKEAVLAICWACNESETQIENPLRADLAILDGAAALHDVRLDSGKYLPEYLDRLLQPLGFNWFVNYDTGIPAEDVQVKNKPRIKVFKRWDGPEKELYFQMPNQVLDLEETNLNSYAISRRIGDSVNQVTVLGGFEKVEFTIELQRTWEATKDSLTASDLAKEDGADYAANPNVWRLFAMNEDGTYNDVRTENVTPDLSAYFTEYIPHRRNIEDPFTWFDAATKQRHEIFVEYSIDGGSTWKECNLGSLVLAPDNVAVLFNGNQPPTELIDAGDDAKMRITGVITGDSRLNHTALPTGLAVNGRTVEQTIEAPQKFRKHTKASTGSYASQLAGGADTIDETAQIQAYAEKLRDEQGAAEVDGSYRLPGIHLAYEIGDQITKIAGREISLNAAPLASGQNRYPQVVRRELVYGPAPYTVLTLDRGIRALTPTEASALRERQAPAEVT